MKKVVVVLLVLALVATCAIALISCNDIDEFKIGVLHINPVDSTSGYTYAHQQGILAMKTALGLKDSQIVYRDSIDDTNSQDINAAIEGLIAEGCNMIIGTSFGYMDGMQEYAEKNPQIIFSHGTGYLDTYGEGKNNNMNNYFGRIYQARYLSGIVAGLKASAGANIGYVSAHGTNIAECTSGVNAFALGVQAVNPNAKVLVKTLNSWWNPTNEAAFAKTLLEDYNCEIVTQHCDTDQPSAQAKAAGKYSIGYNSDMALAIATSGGRDASVLTSVVWNWGAYYTAAVTEALKCFEGGTFKEIQPWIDFGNYYGDFSDGLYDIAPLSVMCADNTAQIIDLVKAEMSKGTADWDVFTNTALQFTLNLESGKYEMTKVARQLKDAAGNNVTVTDANITGNMPYWIAGVEYKA